MNVVRWFIISAFLALGLYFLTGCAQLGDAIRSGGIQVNTKYGRVTYELPQHYAK